MVAQPTPDPVDDHPFPFMAFEPCAYRAGGRPERLIGVPALTNTRPHTTADEGQIVRPAAAGDQPQTVNVGAVSETRVPNAEP
jgi:hypothetical protein